MDEETLKNLIDAAQGGEWGVFTGLLLTILVWLTARLVPLLSRSKAGIPRGWLPWISSLTGVLGAVALALVQEQPWYSAIWSGLVVGAAASGFWSLVGRHLDRLATRGRKAKKKGEEP